MFCNQYLKNFDVKVAEAVLIRKNERFDSTEIINNVGLPCFVKPADGGLTCLLLGVVIPLVMANQGSVG